MENNDQKIAEENILSPEELTDNADMSFDDAPGEDLLENQETNGSAEIQELKDKYLRLLAEFENYKRRTSKERIELFKIAGQEMIVSLLPVIDDFDRALKHGQATEGSTLIHNKIVQILKQKGLIEMNSTGEVFDASLHEAITELPVSDEQKNKVIDTVEKGYYLADKIIRHAKVVVGK